MADNYISRRDKIIASAIDLIGDAGLHALSTKNLALRENVSETLVYKYFGGIDEVLVEGVKQYVAFDDNIQKTALRIDGTYMDKINYYADIYATYYDNYLGMGAIILHYEELLHRPETRDIISECMIKRNTFVNKLWSGALANKELRPLFTPEQLTFIFNGMFTEGILQRRTEYSRKSFKVTIKEMLENIQKSLKY